MDGGIEQGRSYQILRDGKITTISVDYILSNPLQEGLDYKLVVYHYLVDKTEVSRVERFDIAFYRKLLSLVINY